MYINKNLRPNVQAHKLLKNREQRTITTMHSSIVGKSNVSSCIVIIKQEFLSLDPRSRKKIISYDCFCL